MTPPPSPDTYKQCPSCTSTFPSNTITQEKSLCPVCGVIVYFRTITKPAIWYE